MTTSFSDHLKRAEEALSRGEYQEARSAFEAALDAAGMVHERAHALDGLARVSFRLGRRERAADLLEQAIALCLPAAETDKAAAMMLARAWYDKAGFHAQSGRVRTVSRCWSRWSAASWTRRAPSMNAIGRNCSSGSSWCSPCA